jgi:hypothetical protein
MVHTMLKKQLLLAGLLASLAIASLFHAPSSYAASKTETVKFQLGKKSYMDSAGSHKLATAPYKVNGTVMVPLRAMAEGLNADVSLDKATQQLTLTGANFDGLKLKPASNKVTNDKGKSFVLPETIVYIKGTVFVPARSIAKIMGAELKWNGSNSALSISILFNDTAVHKYEYSFDNDNGGWEGGFADLPIDYNPAIYDLQYIRELLPITPNTNNYGMKLNSINRSDDLFMFMTKKIEDLKPNTEYNASLLLKMYTNQSGGMMGVGGAPGESVSIKVGILGKQPKIVEGNGSSESNYLMNIDKGNQSTEGKDAKIVGNIVKPDSEQDGFQPVSFNFNNKVTTNGNGELYVIIGSDSGYEGLTTLYFDDVKLTLKQ